MPPKPRSRRVGRGWKAREERGGGGRSVVRTGEAEAGTETRAHRVRSRSPLRTTPPAAAWDACPPLVRVAPVLEPAGAGVLRCGGPPGAGVPMCGGLQMRVFSGAGGPPGAGPSRCGGPPLQVPGRGPGRVLRGCPLSPGLAGTPLLALRGPGVGALGLGKRSQGCPPPRFPSVLCSASFHAPLTLIKNPGPRQLF